MGTEVSIVMMNIQEQKIKVTMETRCESFWSDGERLTIERDNNYDCNTWTAQTPR